MTEDNLDVKSINSSITSTSMSERVVVREKSHEDELLRRVSSEQKQDPLNNLTFNTMDNLSLDLPES